MPTATPLLSHAAAGDRRFRSIHVAAAAVGKMRIETLACDSGVRTGESNGVETKARGAATVCGNHESVTADQASSGSGEIRNLQPPARGAPHATFGRNGTQADKFPAFFPRSKQPSSLKRITAGVFVRGDAASRGTSFAPHFFVGGPCSKSPAERRFDRLADPRRGIVPCLLPFADDCEGKPRQARRSRRTLDSFFDGPGVGGKNEGVFFEAAVSAS